jgi:hypothetical protein
MSVHHGNLKTVYTITPMFQEIVSRLPPIMIRRQRELAHSVVMVPIVLAIIGEVLVPDMAE